MVGPSFVCRLERERQQLSVRAMSSSVSYIADLKRRGRSGTQIPVTRAAKGGRSAKVHVSKG